MTYLDLQGEVKRRATRDQGGTQFNEATKNVINTSLYRISRESPWRSMRRKAYFNTVTSYTTGSGAVTVNNGSASVTATGATLITDGIQVNRMVKFGGSGTFYRIATITAETTFTIYPVYDGVNATLQTYEILPQEEYNLPIQSGHRAFLWHEAYGYPFKMSYVTDQNFYEHGLYRTIKYISTHYRMWGEDMAIMQPLQPSVISVVSSSASDTSIPITIFGVVSGYPDYEIINTNGLTVATGSKSFSTIERVTAGASRVGRVSVTDSALSVLAVIPVGDTTAGIVYKKIQLYPLPNKVFPINVHYYKDPYALVNDNDVHELGGEFDEAIICLAVAKIKQENMQSEASGFYQLYKDELTALKRTNMDKIDWFPTLLRPNQRYSDIPLTPSILYRQFGAGYGPASRM